LPFADTAQAGGTLFAIMLYVNLYCGIDSAAHLHRHVCIVEKKQGCSLANQGGDDERGFRSKTRG
jgi:hypothetical protein